MKIAFKFVKKEPVLIGAVILAIVTCFFVPPSLEYIGYINFETLARLFGLMLIIKAMSRIRAFQILSANILPKIKTTRGLVTALVFIPTFFSLFITNDVSIVTFVPFAIIVLGMCDKTHLILKTVILITIGCNLGGLISPLGNSQNLYLFAYYDLPSTYLIRNAYITSIAAFGLLLVLCLTTKKEKIESFEDKKREIKKGKLSLYAVLLLLVISSVIIKHSFYYLIVFGLVVAIMIFVDRGAFKSVNYSILVTFLAFFIFSGNIKNIQVVSNFLSKIIEGNEYWLCIGISQFFTATPTVIIISQFSNNVLPVVLGSCVGKNGSLIASLSALVVFSMYTSSVEDKPLKFLGQFTLYSGLFLITLAGVGYLNLLLIN